ncbi:hypothetical protein DRE_04365 [Drechslerella stenobrocha 248]|uniref:Blue (type 1) copper domain-containing protein n=1 Tax=Drechslerella stenobrocha 248 TaxID=1043628 RepID=W7I1M7_9PEZI|nr:hypothetical protein DRE_04365 [Drechslerella stenobrocha 248]
MVAFKPFTVFAAAVALASTVFAAPTPTKDLSGRDYYSGTAPAGATHSVVVGRGGLRFDPENIVAEIGDVVEFHFTPRNHSVVQSNFANPCVPNGPDAFFSGFFPTESGQNEEVFTIKIWHKNPIWFYCSQTVGDHCQMGMSGVINQNFDSNEFTLSRYKENARNLFGIPAVSPKYIAGGARTLNPNPLSGF